MKNDKVKELQNAFIDEFVNCLKEKKMIWERGWNIILHKNLVSNLDYKGYNQLLLMYVANKKGVNENHWLTFNQASQNKMVLKKGAKSVPIQYFSYYDEEKKQNISYRDYQIAVNEGRKDKIKVIKKYYNIFNLADVKGYEPKEEEKTNDILLLDEYIKKSNLEIEFVGNQPCYIPALHKILMTPRKQFKNDDEYYSTLLHELSHSTKKHIERDFPDDVKTEQEKYAFEELIAEISSVLLCCEFGIELKSIQNNKAYIQSWIEKLNKDKERYLMKAIKNANSVTQYIVNHLG
ncbi:DUF1738 domain-containing protein [[Clostridium] innocuum]|nr:DUF1738 domain-containing protein [[Clostridium] innocuum]